MKALQRLVKQIAAALFILCIVQNVTAQNTFPSNGAAGIGTTTPDASSLLEIKSTSKGFLIPRMTIAQRNAIVSPATGLLIYQTNSTPGIYYYNGTAWKAATPKSTGWSLTGNAGTNPSTNFIGTTDDQPLVFKINNTFAGTINRPLNNTFLGYQAGIANTTGYNNTANGAFVLSANTTGYYNTANGVFVLSANTTGNYNTANGAFVLFSNTTGNDNTANGVLALFSNTTGNDNTANGMNALYNNTAGYNNIANGTEALYANTTGYYNTANGSQALYANTTGYDNTANGRSALYYNTTGYENTANGVYALSYNTAGNYNTANGFQALTSNTTGNYNTANGLEALGSNTKGYNNTANGVFALYANTSGYYNTANGYQALYYNNYGNSNTANGYWALYSNTLGGANTANGGNALYRNTTGYNNTADGLDALFHNTTGFDNTANGFDALYSNTTGYNNTGLGYYADVTDTGLINATVIGYNAVVDASNKVRIGNTDVTSIGGQVGWTSFSDGRYKKNIKTDVQGLKFINLLKPITYTVDINALNNYYDKNGKHDSAYDKMKTQMQPEADKAAKIIYNGFIAQDVEKAAQSLNYNFSGVDKPQTENGLYGLRYADFVVPLVKAVQELSKMNDDKDAAIDSLKNENVSLRKDFNDLKNLVLQIQQQQQTCGPCSSGITSSIQQSNITFTDAAMLDQNTPNPFNNNTIIKYYVPSLANNAELMITDANGHTLKSFALSNKGAGQVNISAGTLSSGSYFYSLLVDGRKIDTKQMILTK